MKKNKLYFQIISCMIISAVFFWGSNTNHEAVSQCYSRAKEMMMHQMSLEDVQQAGAYMKTQLSGAPAKVVSAVSKANEKSLYSQPIDENSDSAIKQVHAAAGGMVIAAGKDKERGLYIEIKHDDAISIYGQLQDISVAPSERVQRGEIIGSYNTDEEKDFYYELRENL